LPFHAPLAHSRDHFNGSTSPAGYDEDGLFSKIVGRHTVERRDHGDNQAARSSHHSGGQGRGTARRGKPSIETEEQSLKAREYRDSEGNVHHHTNTYMRQHGTKKSAG
jgi:hypothetical protein